MNRLLFLFVATCFASTPFSLSADQIVLEDVMTKEDRQKTGVDHLSLSQKVALEAWLNKNFILKTQEQPKEAQLSLSINIDNGQKLQLSDNSIWEIAPNDIPTSAVWITPFPVKITPSNDQQYPWLIVNVNSGVSVKARKISAIP
jgi:hypothetical protein